MARWRIHVRGPIRVPVSAITVTLPAKRLPPRCWKNVRRLPNVRILEHIEVTDIIEAPQGNRCVGAVCADRRGGEGAERRLLIRAPYTMLATGGIGGSYERSTNFPSLTGDACRIAQEHGVALEHMDYVQIHPTSLYVKHPGRAFLISESCRGEGAILLDAKGNRFTDELQPARCGFCGHL